MNKERTMQFIAGWLILAIFSVALFPHPDIALLSDIPRQGIVSAKSYVAPISFELPKTTEQLKREREQAEAKVRVVLEFNSEATGRILNNFHETMKLIDQYGRLTTRMSQTVSSGELQLLSREIAKIQQQLSHTLSSTAIHHLSLHAEARDTLAKVFEEVMTEGVSELLLASTPRQVTLYQEYHNVPELKSLLYAKTEVDLIRNGHEMTSPVSSIRPREVVIEDAFARIQLFASNSQGLQSAFYETLHTFTEPNIFYLEQETEKRRKAAAAEVNSSKGMVVKGMEIIAPGAIVTQEAVEKLEALHAALQAEEGERSSMTSGLGQTLFLLVLSALFCLYLVSMKSTHFVHIRHYWALIAIHILQMIAFNLADRVGNIAQQPSQFFPEGTDFIWIQPFLIAPVLCTVLFHFRIGLVSAIYTAVHMGMQSSFDLALTLSAFLTAWATIQFLHQIRYRSHFILSSVMGILTLNLVLMISLLLRNRMGWQDFWPQSLLGSLSILFCVSLSSLFLIHLFERIFGITTNLTLMELSDFNHPALKQLSERAPGSFHHSIMVGNLAEKAATRIGANPLLTRVIALYHDIGKSDRPAFFTENQKRGENPHDPMDPYASMKLIRDHVVDGLRLAKEYKLPEIISAGIPEHHGDNLIHSFYRKAKLAYPDREISAADFRYPGPRPRSKETALVMLADGIEATSRSMEDPTAEALSLLVQNVIQTRLQEDQLRESTLSINDLEEIEIGFLQSLEGMFHTRIKYPDGVFITNKVLP